MSKRLVVIKADDLKNMLTVYTQGDVPLDTELKEIAVNEHLQRMIIFTMGSKQWKETTYDPVLGKLRPLLVRYEGKKTLSWHQKPDEPMQWKDFSKKG